MGNYKFKFSDMIPNAWFYKLRDLSKQHTRNLKHPTKKKLHHNTSSTSNPNPVNSPGPTSPSSSSKNGQIPFSLSSHFHQRKSYYFNRDVNFQPASPNHDTFFYPGAASTYTHRNRRPNNFYDEAHGVQPPGRSSKKKRSTRRSRASPRLASAGCSCRTTLESVWTNLPYSASLEYPTSAVDYTSSAIESLLPQKCSVAGVTSTETIHDVMLSSCDRSCRLFDDDVIDVEVDDEGTTGLGSVPETELPPIKTKGSIKETKPSKIRRETTKHKERNGHESLSMSVRVGKEDTVSNYCCSPREDEKSSPKANRNSVTSHSLGLKLRTNSPRIGSRRIRGRKSVSSSNWRRSLSDSMAVVKTSKDPQRDFRDSMLEMIVENNIRSSKELEDLLACYLSLNSDEYHHVIITVFKQLWFDVVHSHLNY